MKATALSALVLTFLHVTIAFSMGQKPPAESVKADPKVAKGRYVSCNCGAENIVSYSETKVDRDSGEEFRITRTVPSSIVVAFEVADATAYDRNPDKFNAKAYPLCRARTNKRIDLTCFRKRSDFEDHGCGLSSYGRTLLVRKCVEKSKINGDVASCLKRCGK